MATTDLPPAADHEGAWLYDSTALVPKFSNATNWLTLEPTIAAGTSVQYWRGDKSWQLLDKAAVGLGNVDNTSDANKPVSTAQATAIGLKLNANAVSAFGLTLIDDADATTARSTLGLVIGTNVQAYSPNLTTWAGVVPGAGIAAFLATPSSANLLAALTTKTGTGNVVFSASPSFTGTANFAAVNASDRIDAGNVISVSGGSGFTAGPRMHIYYSGGGFFDSYNSTTATYTPVTFSGSDLNFRIGITSAFRVNNTFGNFANDAAAAAGGVPVGYLYRTGSVVQIRVA